MEIIVHEQLQRAKDLKIIWGKRKLLERDGGLADPRKIRLEIQHLVGLERERSLREMEALRRIESGRIDAQSFLQQQTYKSYAYFQLLMKKPHLYIRRVLTEEGCLSTLHSMISNYLLGLNTEQARRYEKTLPYIKRVFEESQRIGHNNLRIFSEMLREVVRLQQKQFRWLVRSLKTFGSDLENELCKAFNVRPLAPYIHNSVKQPQIDPKKHQRWRSFNRDTDLSTQRVILQEPTLTTKIVQNRNARLKTLSRTKSNLENEQKILKTAQSNKNLIHPLLIIQDLDVQNMYATISSKKSEESLKKLTDCIRKRNRKFGLNMRQASQNS